MPQQKHFTLVTKAPSDPPELLAQRSPDPNPGKQNGIIAPNTPPRTYTSPHTDSSKPVNPAAAPSRHPATFRPTAPDFGAAVLLALGAGVVDDELDGVGLEELEEAGAELEVVEVVEVVEVTKPFMAEVRLAVGEGAEKDDVSAMIALGTEAVEAKLSVAAEIAPLAAEDAPTAAFEAAVEAVASTLWTAAEAEARGATGMGRCVGIPETAVLASAAVFEAAVTAAVAIELAVAASELESPATFEATAPSSDAAD